MKYLIDYFMFVVKPDKHSEFSFPFSFDYLLNEIGLYDLFPSFYNIGGRMHYAETWLYENIRIYCPFSDEFDDMGYCVEMTGQGCRFYEDYMRTLFGIEWSWVDLFKKLNHLVNIGCSVNINRVDFAFDDFDGLLEMNTIENCARNREYVSLFRSCKKVEEHSKCSFQVNSDFTKFGEGKTVYFGSRKSNTFCRFYDKLLEQKKHFQNDLEQLEKLNKINHWVRFEIVFKRSVAIKILSAMIRLNEHSFNEWLAEIINGYLRFIDIDNNNVSRCTIKQWWSDFLGVVERAKLKCVGVSSNAFSRALGWFCHSVAPTLSAIVSNVGFDELQNLITEFGTRERWKQKHYNISSSSDLTNPKYSCRQIWELLVPDSVLERCAV